MSSPAPSSPRSRGPWIIGGVLAVVVVLFVVVRLLGGDAGSSARPDDVGEAASTDLTASASAVAIAPVAVTGTPLVPMTDRGPDRAVGAAFPVLRGVDTFDASPVEIARDGQAKVVVFVAHWCPHCQREVPVITAWIEQNGMPDDVDLYAVSTAVSAERGNYPPASWLARENWPVRTMADDEQATAFAAAGMTSFPSFVAIGADGQVRGRTSGELSVAEWEALLALARS